MAYSEGSSFTAPFYVGCLFPMDEDQRELEAKQIEAQAKFHPSTQPALSHSRDTDYNSSLLYETLKFQFLDTSLRLRQFDDHPTNANALWPEATYLAEWIAGVDKHAEPTIINEHRPPPRVDIDERRLQSLLIGPNPARPYRVLELGSATGALSIYLRIHGVDIVSSDLDDSVITANIAHNFGLNGLSVKHWPHSWGRDLDQLRARCESEGEFDVILGSDLLAYEDSFDALAQTLACLTPPHSHCVLYMCWKRRNHSNGGGLSPFFVMMESRGFSVVKHPGGMYEIRRPGASLS